MPTRLKRIKLAIVLCSAAVSLYSKDAFALGASSPISASNGTISCTTCTTAGSTYTANSVLYGTGTGRATSGVTVNGTATKKYLSQTSSGAPSFDQPQISELQTFSSANLASALSDKTGTAGKVVFDTSPTIDGITLTGTVTLPAGAIDSLTDIASGIKSGTSGSAKLVTTTSGSITTNNCAKWDANGNLVDAGTNCGGVTPLTAFSSLTPVTVTTTSPVYLSLSGDVSTTETDVQTPIKNATTLGNLQCVANTGTTSAITATVGTGVCGSTISYTTKAKVDMSTSANTAGTSSGTTSISAGNCAVVKLTVSTTDADPASIHCSVERTA